MDHKKQLKELEIKRQLLRNRSSRITTKFKELLIASKVVMELRMLPRLAWLFPLSAKEEFQVEM